MTKTNTHTSLYSDCPTFRSLTKPLRFLWNISRVSNVPAAFGRDPGKREWVVVSWWSCSRRNVSCFYSNGTFTGSNTTTQSMDSSCVQKEAATMVSFLGFVPWSHGCRYMLCWWCLLPFLENLSDCGIEWRCRRFVCGCVPTSTVRYEYRRTESCKRFFFLDA